MKQNEAKITGITDEKLQMRLQKIFNPDSSSHYDATDLKNFFDAAGNQPFFVGFGEAKGESRDLKAIDLALAKSFSEREKIHWVKKVLLHITYSSTGLTIDEIAEINNVILKQTMVKPEITMLLSETDVDDDLISIVVVGC